MRNVSVAERSWVTDEQGGMDSEPAMRAAAEDRVAASFLSYSHYTFSAKESVPSAGESTTAPAGA